VAECSAFTDLNDFERKFVKDQHDRIAQYGDKVKLPTEKQMAVLKGIVDKRQGKPQKSPVSGPPAGHPAFHDEIPY
jgi:hypothetical protein